MTIAPPRRKSRIVFWIAALIAISAVLATALLANDRHNLRLLAERYHWTWLNLDPPATKAPNSATQPGSGAGRQAASQRGSRLIAVRQVKGQPVSPHFFSTPQQAESDFVRRWKVSGEKLCDEIAAAGIPMGRWHPSEFGDATSECSMETPFTPSETGADPPSLFAIVRGSQNGDIQTVRIKAILPQTAAGNAMKDRFVSLTRLIISETQWLDFNMAGDKIAKLQDITQSDSGVKLTFSHEFENPRRFNLLLEMDRSTPELEKAANFFDTRKRLPLPQP